MKTIENLEKNLTENFQIRSKYYNELQDKLFDSIKEQIGINIEKLYGKVFSSNNGFELTFKNSDNLIIGELNVLRVHYSFAPAIQERFIQVYDEWGEEFKTFARQFYPLDIYKEALDSITLTAVKIIDEEHLELWIWNNAGQKYKLKFKSIEEYLEAGVQFKFVIFWQYFYIDNDAMDFSDPFTKEWVAFSYSDAISRMNEALETLQEYFPKEDWSYQEKELERVKDL